MPAPGEDGGGHMQTGTTLTEKANPFHSQIHRFSPQVQNSNWRTLQTTAPSTTTNSWFNIQQTLANSRDLWPEIPNARTGEIFPPASLKALQNRGCMAGYRLTKFLEPNHMESLVESTSYATLGKGGILGFKQTSASILVLRPRLPPNTISAATARHQQHFWNPCGEHTSSAWVEFLTTHSTSTPHLAWNAIPRLNCLSGTVCKSSWWEVLGYDSHVGA